MARTTDKELEAIVEQLNIVTNSAYDFSISHGYGGVRLWRDGGNMDVSPLLAKGELAMWMRAFINGLNHATKAGYYAHRIAL